MAARKLQELSDALRLLIVDADKFTNVGQHDEAIKRAVTRLSQFRPRVRIHEVTGDGTAFRFNAPSDWQGGFSFLKKVLYPVDTGSQSLAPEIPIAEVQIQLQPDDTFKIHFVTLVPASGSKAWLYYTVEHSVSNDATTLKSVDDEDSVIYWAAAECLRVMAAKVNASKNIEELASMTNRESRGSQYLKLAKEYEERSGLMDGAALAWGPINPGTSTTENYLTH
ncbi:hypothetical protein HUU59_10940 [bacterium]|nr:hypothetical protein [bacterium]